MAVIYMAVLFNIWIFYPSCICSGLISMCPSVLAPDSSMNTASLVVNTEAVGSTIVFQMISKECYTCLPQNVTHVPDTVYNCTVIVDTRWPTVITVISESLKDVMDKSCSDMEYAFKENGDYAIYVTRKNSTISCKGPYTLNNPSDANITIYVTLGIFVLLYLLWTVYNNRHHSCRRIITENISEKDLGSPTNVVVQEATKNKKERLKSLDTFRGLSLVIMMFVNYGGAGYWFLQHSKWNGLTVADLVFPWFIWIMGTAMAFSYQSLIREGIGKGRIFMKIVRRSAILFVLGILVNSGGFQNFTQFRIMGVLQRFSLTYLVTATIHMCFMQVATNTDAYGKLSIFQDITNYWAEWIVQLIIVLVHLLFTFFLSVPGCPTGYLGPGGLANDAGSFDVGNCTGGAGGYVDRTVFGDKIIYQSPTCAEIYKTTIPYDPEGLMGTLNACFLCFLGLQAGKIIKTYKDFKARCYRFLSWAFVLGLLAGTLCKFSKNDGLIPVNKNLWSLSFVFALSSMAFVLLTLCYLSVDVFKVWTGSPFYYPGMNSIVVYVCHEVFSSPFMRFWGIKATTHAIFMLINIWDVTFWTLLSYFLFYNDIFVSV